MLKRKEMNCEKCGKSLVDEAAYCMHCGTAVPDAPIYEEYEYEAFISYRHLPRDSEVAVRLQKALEGFTVPKALRSVSRSKKLGRLFRDKDELPTSSSLNDQIRDALKRSPFLVVVCTPDTNESLWIKEEVELFASFHGRDKILLALAEGEPDESFPTLLRSRMKLSDSAPPVEVEEEPLAADFRNASRKTFATEALRIAAPLLGCGFDDLRQRQRARKQRLALGAASGVALVSLAFGSFSFYQQAQIQENYRQVQINESELLASEADNLLAQGDRMQAIQVALAALPESANSEDRPFVPEAQLSLEKALGLYPTQGLWNSWYSLPGVKSSKMATSSRGYVATIGISGEVSINDLETGKRVSSFNVNEVLEHRSNPTYESLTMAFARDKLVCTWSKGLACFDAETGSLVWFTPLDGFDSMSALAISQTEELVATTTISGFYETVESNERTNTLHVLSLSDGSEQTTVTLPSVFTPGVEHSLFDGKSVCFADSDQSVIVGGSGSLHKVDLRSGSVVHALLAKSTVTQVACLDSTIMAISRESYIPTGENPVLEAFDTNLVPLWSHEGKENMFFDAQGVGHEAKTKAIGTVELEEHESAQIVLMDGNEICLIDANDGTITRTIKKDAPFLDCLLIGKEDPMIVACTFKGDLITRWPARSETAGGAYDQTLASRETARFVQEEKTGTVYLTAWHDNPGTAMVYAMLKRKGVGESHEIENTSSSSSWWWHQSALFEVSDDRLRAYDPNSFNVRFEISRDSYDAIDDSLHPAVADFNNTYLFVYGDEAPFSDSGTENSMVYVFSGADGNAMGSFKIEGLDSLGYASNLTICSSQDKPVTLVRGHHEVRTLDALTGRLIYSIERGGMIKDAWYSDDAIVLCETEDSDKSETVFTSDDHQVFTMVDTSTGEDRACDLSKCAPQNQSGQPAASLGAKRKRFVAACDDGTVKMFDLASGGLLWSSNGMAGRIRYVAIDDEVSGNVLIQDDAGFCILLSGESGAVLQTSSTTLPPIQSTWYSEDSQIIVASWVMEGLASMRGITLVSLDERSFGPLSTVSYGAFISPDGNTVLARDGLQKSISLLHHYSLDESIELANELIQGHELTDAERYLYRVGK